ncbi:MAG: hypothetical protein WCA19_01745 [Candidatus Acidiferrales bacterium]
MNQSPFIGSHAAFLWLTTEQHDLDSLLRGCPQAFLGKYIAVTSHDSGPLTPTEEERGAGWQTRNEVAYSPPIQTVAGLPHGICGGFDEWYVFESPTDLGELWHGNIFEKPPTSRLVSTFVNYLGFALHNPEVEGLVSHFWKQLDWIQPESYIADGNAFLTFVTRNQELFAAVRKALSS